MKIKKLMYLLALSLPTLVLADLPSTEQSDALYGKKCGINWPTQKGGFTTKPLFAVKGVSTPMSIKQIDGNIEISTNIGKTLKSLLCYLTGCELKTPNYYYVDTVGAGEFSPSTLLSDFYNYSNYQSVVPGSTTSRTANFTFNTRGITHAMVHRFDESVVGHNGDYIEEIELVEVTNPGEFGRTITDWVPSITQTYGNAYGTVGFNQSIPVSCDTEFVYVQNAPTVSVEKSSTTSGGSIYGTFYFDGTIDNSYSRFGTTNQPIQYEVKRKLISEWTGQVCNVVEEGTNWEYIRGLSTSNSLSFSNIDCMVHYQVRSFDGTHYSPWVGQYTIHNPAGNTGGGNTGGGNTGGGSIGGGGSCTGPICNIEN